MRYCYRHRSSFSIDNFGPASTGNGYDNCCKECRQAIIEERNLPDYNKRIQYLAKRHRTTVAKILKITRAAGNHCEICGLDFDKVTTQQHYDHDHETGELRGVLCVGCNSAIGAFHDSISKLESGIKYLKKYKARDRFV